eukprot:jgi/Phyca11/4859/fgenesh1_pm.PHYCAscaffold_3_\
MASERQMTLSVKGRLSNQEMEQLRNQLAQAAAYAHVPEHQRAARAAKAQPKKILASIQYEQKFSTKAHDSLKPRPTRGIGAEARTILQDEYVTKPREVSYIPRNLSNTNEVSEGSKPDNQVSGGKRRGPATIPQLFIM